MALPLVKRAAESRAYVMSLVNLPEIIGGDTIANITGVVADTPAGASALTLTGVASYGSAKGVKVNIAGGTDGVLYTVTFTVVTVNGYTLVGIGQLLIDDQP